MNNIYKKISLINIDKLIYLSIFVIYVGFIINGCLLKIGQMISPGVENIIDILLFFIEGGIIAITLFLLLIKKPKRILCIYGISIGIFLLSYYIFPENRGTILAISRSFFLYNITAFILFIEASKDSKLYEKIMKMIKCIFIFSVLYLLILIYKGESLYNVWLAKYFFLTSIFTVYDFYKNKNILSLTINILCLLALLITGSRTYLLLFCAFAILMFTLFIKKKIKVLDKKKKIVLIISILVISTVIVLALIHYQEICNNLYNFFSEKGIEIRILRLVSTNNFFTSNDRLNRIYPMTADLIKENWLLGTGIGGDRVWIFNFYQEMGIAKEGYGTSAYYSHNLILELYSNFGVIIASIIMGVIIYSYCNTIRCKNENINVILCLTFCSILPLMLAGTMWDNVYLWSLLGILIANLFDLKPIVKSKEK